MTIDEAIKLLRLEEKCVYRADNCDRKCDKCDLVQDSDKLLEMYSRVIIWLIELKTLKNSEYNKGYNKAIDEVIAKIKNEWEMQELYLPIHFIYLLEELKKGGNNEN